MIAENLTRIQDSLPAGVTLVAISKYQPTDAIREAYGTGQRVYGESRPQEMVAKYKELPKDIEWHMIGHLQTNKVKYIAPFVSLIHSVDSMKLADVIDKEAEKCGRIIDVLLQIHIAQEDTKFGWNTNELERFLQGDQLTSLEHIRIRGVMGMASMSDDAEQVKTEFSVLHNVFLRLKEQYLPQIDVLSMGMSGDYPLAIDQGATMVRIGSNIFGGRH